MLGRLLSTTTPRLFRAAPSRAVRSVPRTADAAGAAPALAPAIAKAGRPECAGIDLGAGAFVEMVGSVAELWHTLSVRLPVLLRRGVRLVVIDSIAALFRTEFEHTEGVARAAALSKPSARDTACR